VIACGYCGRANHDWNGHYLMAQGYNTLFGVDLDDLKLDVRRGLKWAAEMEFRAVELGAVEGDVTPQNLGSSGRRELARLADGLGLSLAAFSAEMPHLRLSDTRAVEERIDRTCRIIDLARDVRVPTVTAGLGALTDRQTGQPSELAVEALSRIGDHADSRGVRFALRPSYDAGVHLTAVLDAIRCPSLVVCLDPAAVVMTGANPLASIERYIEQVKLFHARDATAGFSDPHGGEPHLGRETPLGEGDVDIVGVLEVLRAVDYRGPYILRRHDARDPIQEIQSARETLRRMMSE
jgi:sugar phosphate isomerase/epimerase